MIETDSNKNTYTKKNGAKQNIPDMPDMLDRPKKVFFIKQK